jgi:hypothetical protein
MRKFVLVLIVGTLLTSSCKQAESSGTGGDTAAFTDTSATSPSPPTTSSNTVTTAMTDTTKTDKAAAKKAK